jgi:C_GCAxxG_C_C family probable redox protein
MSIRLTEKTVERCVELLDQGYLCAEAVLLAIAESKEIHSDLIPKIATGFSTGIGKTGGLCGALIGAILAINIFTGRSSARESTRENYAMVKKLINRFEKKYGSSGCKELLGCDLGTLKGQYTFLVNDLFDKCTEYTEEATRITMGLIEDL